MIGVHPTWEVELSTITTPFLADHQVQGSTLVPGAVYIEMALAAANATYGSTDYSVDDLTLLRAVILDDTCDPVLRTTLNRDTGTLEFAAFTATAGGDVKWTITATAELNTVGHPHGRAKTPPHANPVSTIGRDEFYTRTQAVGFDYGDAFQSITGITSGDGWATADISAPVQIADDIDQYRFHPALIDGAFQTLLGTTVLGRNTTKKTPTFPRESGAAPSTARPNNMTAEVTVVSATRRDRKRHHTHRQRRRAVRRLHWFHVASAERVVAHVARTDRQGPLRDRMGCTHRDGGRFGRRSDINGQPVVADFPDSEGVGTTLADQLRRSGHRVRVLLRQPVSALTKVDGGYSLNPEQPEQIHQFIATHIENEGDLAGIIDCWPLDISAEPY